MKKYNRKTIVSIVGSKESVELELVTNMDTGKSFLSLHKTITQRFETNKLDYVKDLAEKLMGGGGRRVYSLEDLINNNIKTR